ncbi:MAG: YfhO family protein [Flavobacteriales bacterium]
MRRSGLFHIFVLFCFVVLSVLYAIPIIHGKKLYQPDTVNYMGSTKEVRDYEQKTGRSSLWTDSMFGGMPIYFLSAKYKDENNVISHLDKALRFLPQPADYLFILLLGFYILMLGLRIEPKLAAIGSLAFSLSTYFIIIIAAGHNGKVIAIAYTAPTVAGVLMLFRKKYILGFLLTTIFLSLNIYANHPQMTYYMFLLMGIYIVIQAIHLVRTRAWKPFAKIIGILAAAVFISLAVNATPILAIRQYSPYSTRGKSELTHHTKDQTQGLERGYITQWSYGKMETFNLLIANLMGGSSYEAPESKPHLRRALSEKNVAPAAADYFLRAIPTYWGDQPFVLGPAYQGAVVIFLFVLGLFLVKDRFKWWLAIGAVLSILLAWGKNFPLLTDFFIDYFPLYDKFRVVASLLILFELIAPLLGFVALRHFFSTRTAPAERRRALRYSASIVLGLIAFLLLLGPSLFSFKNQAIDPQIPAFLQAAIRADRLSLFRADAIRSFALVAVAVLVLYLFSKKRINYDLSLFLLAALILIDLWPVDRRYLNAGNFVSQKVYGNPFPKTAIEDRILKDSSNFRVLNSAVNTMTDPSTSYYFKSLGGCHAAKLRKYQELYDFQIAKGNQQVIDMLNAKYIITADGKGTRKVIKNTRANGNAWFVKGVTYVKDADAALAALDTLQTRDYAVVQQKFNTEKFNTYKPSTWITHPNDTIFLKRYTPDKVVYTYSASTPQFAVLSEIYYPAGWKATIDGSGVPYLAANYVLRALWVPAGTHTLVFQFDPPIVRTGKAISLAGSILLIAAVGFSLFAQYRNRSRATM